MDFAGRVPNRFGKFANVKNRSFSGTECKQPSIFQVQPSQKEKQTVPLYSEVNQQSARSWSFRAAVPHWSARTACHWHSPASGAFIKCCPFLFLAVLSNMLLRRHGKCTSQIAFLPFHVHFLFLPLLSVTLSFPFLVLFPSFPICL